MIEMKIASDTLAPLLRELDQFPERLSEELRIANTRIGLKVSGDAKKLMQSEIYNVPIPLKASVEKRTGPDAAIRKKTTKGSKGRWMRTANLKRLETFRLDGPRAVILENTANYAAPRAALGMSNPPNAAGRQSGEQSGKSPTKAIGNWQERAALQNRQWIFGQYLAALQRVRRGSR